MLRTIVLTAAFCIASSTALLQAAGLSQAITPTIPSGISDICFVDARNGWIVGNSGMIMHSVDGGTSWKAQPSGVTANLQRVFFVNAQVGYVSLSGQSTILRTSDGGATWNRVSLPVSPATDTARTPYAIYFMTPAKGFVGCGKSAAGDIFMTTDSGRTWTSKLNLLNQSAYITDLTFSGPNRGVAVANNYSQIYYTSNGGATWTKAATPSVGTVSYTGSAINAVAMTDSLHVSICGWGSWFQMQPMMLFSSADGGATFTYRSPTSAAAAPYGSGYDLYFKDKNNGIAIGGFRGSLIVKTTDGGITWTQTPVLSGHQLRALAGIGDTLWATSLNGLIVRSTDFGATWKVLTSDTQEQIESAQFVTPTIGYLATAFGGLRKTTDGGAHWTSMNPINPGTPGNVIDNVQAVKWVDANVGYAAHNYGAISRTTDGGVTWSIVVPGDSSTNSSARALCVLNANKVLAVRTKGATTSDQLITLTNGSYSIRDTVLKKQPNDVAFYDDNRGIIVGASGAIKYTTNGGTSWADGTVSGLPAGKTLSSSSIYMVQIVDSTSTWAVGSALLLKSTDLGKTWTYVAHNIVAPDTILYAMHFLNKSTGYVGGLRGGLSVTNNGGATWTQVPGLDITNAVWEIAFKPADSSAWICTSIGNVFTTSGVTAVAPAAGLPREFTLEQNYPNPFNPSTTIEYTVASRRLVTLKVYTILGQEAATLVNSVQDAGAYSVKFDAHALSSGIYFYSLSSDGVTTTRRMILMK